MLTSEEIFNALLLNTKDMQLAINNQEYFKLFDLQLQRDMLKSTLIDALNMELAKARKAS